MALRSKSYLSVVGVNNNDVLLDLLGGNLEGMEKWAIQVISGTVRVFGSVANGATPTLAAQQLVLAEEPSVTADAVAAQEGTLVAVASSARLAWFFGKYTRVQLQQAGATAARCYIMGSGERM